MTDKLKKKRTFSFPLLHKPAKKKTKDKKNALKTNINVE